MISRFRSCIAAAVLALPVSAFAAGAIDQLRAFVESTQSGRATFEQQVTAKSGRKPQNASGTMAFSRPGKFRWTYDKPYYQLLVGDGEKLWVHDRDLNQVTVKRLGDALASTPQHCWRAATSWKRISISPKAAPKTGWTGSMRSRKPPRAASRRCASDSRTVCCVAWCCATVSARRRSCVSPHSSAIRPLTRGSSVSRRRRAPT